VRSNKILILIYSIPCFSWSKKNCYSFVFKYSTINQRFSEIVGGRGSSQSRVCWVNSSGQRPKDRSKLRYKDVCKDTMVYHLHGNSGDYIRKVNGTRRPNRNFSGMNGLFEKVVLSYRLERFNRRILAIYIFLFFHQFQAFRDLIQTGWVFHVKGKQPFSTLRSVTLNGKRIIRMGFSI
jgi:hypothetical protein